MKSNNTSSTDNCCDICNKHFTLKRNLRKHLKAVHNQIEKLDDKYGLHCPLDCKPRFITRKYALLRDHISSHHGVTIKCEEKTFSSLEEFVSWKRGVESRCGCSYTAKTAPKPLSFGRSRTYYVCRRSGRGLTNGRRAGHCPSTLELTRDDGSFVARLFATHVGHPLEAARVGLTRVERDYLAARLANGESYRKIMADVNADTSEGNNPRRHLLTRRELYKIKYEMGRANRATADLASTNQEPVPSTEGLKRKLGLLLGLMDEVTMDAGSCSALEQVLDTSIAFVMERGAVDESCCADASSLHTNDVSGGPGEWNVTPFMGMPGLEEPTNGEGDLHFDVIPCLGEDFALRVVSDPPPKVIRPPGRPLLPKPITDIHLDVIRLTPGDEPRSLGETDDPECSESDGTSCEGGNFLPGSIRRVIGGAGSSVAACRDVYLNVIRCKDDETPTPREVRGIEARSVAKRKRPASFVRVYVTEDGGKVGGNSDFDRVYNIDV